MIDKSTLKELAAAATQGPWELRTHEKLPSFVQAHTHHDMPYPLEVLGDDYSGFGDGEQRHADAAYIAAANPAAILELLAENERLAEQLHRAETVLNRAGFNGDSVQGWTAPIATTSTEASASPVPRVGGNTCNEIGGSSPADAGGLTPERISEIFDECGGCDSWLKSFGYTQFALAIEREVLSGTATSASASPAAPESQGEKPLAYISSDAMAMLKAGRDISLAASTRYMAHVGDCAIYDRPAGAAPVAGSQQVPEGWRDVIENVREHIGAGALSENAQHERAVVEPYLDTITDELEALAAAAPAVPVPVHTQGDTK